VIKKTDTRLVPRHDLNDDSVKEMWPDVLKAPKMKGLWIDFDTLEISEVTQYTGSIVGWKQLGYK